MLHMAPVNMVAHAKGSTSKAYILSIKRGMDMSTLVQDLEIDSKTIIHVSSGYESINAR